MENRVITKRQIVDWLSNYGTLVDERVDEFNKLDAAIGDGDYGSSIKRGFNAIRPILVTKYESDDDIGAMLKELGMKLMSVMGGTSGPLTGTFYVMAGMAVGGKMALTAAELTRALTAGVDAIMGLGKAQVGEKTMIDALKPAVIAMETAVENGEDDLAAVLQAGVDAAEKGYKSTADIVASKGRASYVGERSIGKIDPGAYASYLLFDELYKVVQKQPDLDAVSAD